MEQFDFAYSVIERLEAASTTSGVLSELARVGFRFGLDRFILAGIPAPGKKLEPYVLLHNWPGGWYERYNARDYLHADPVIRQLQTTTAPVVWSEAPYDRATDKAGHAVTVKSLVQTAATLRLDLAVYLLKIVALHLEADHDMVEEAAEIRPAKRKIGWPAPGSADTELGVLMGPEVSHGETEVCTRVQA